MHFKLGAVLEFEFWFLAIVKLGNPKSFVRHGRHGKSVVIYSTKIPKSSDTFAMYDQSNPF